MKAINKGPAIIGMCFITFALGVFALRIVFAQEVTKNQELTTAAWQHLDAKKYEDAISSAGECIALFSGEAEIEQEELTANKVPLPSTRPTEAEKEIIFGRGLLNDVAASYFILGKANEALGKKQEAIREYKEAKKFSHAMVWDEQGFFWSVSKGAAGRVRFLEKAGGG